jgi:hypothetical protein
MEVTADLPDTPVADEVAKLAKGGVRGGELFELLPTTALRSIRAVVTAEATIANAQVSASGSDILTATLRSRHDALRAFLEVLQVELDGRVE